MNITPSICRKQDLRKKLHLISEKVLNPVIWEAILANRPNLTIEEAKNTKTVLKPEVEYVLKAFGELN